MARGTRERLERPVPFEQFALSELPLKEVPTRKGVGEEKDPRAKNKEGRLACSFRNSKTGRSVDGSLSVDVREKKEYIQKSNTQEVIRVTAASKGSEIRLVMEMIHGPQSTHVSMDIAREDTGKKNKLPPGTGMMLYEKGLDYLEARAKTRTFTHGVIRETMTTTPTSLTRGQWQKLFPPLLTKRGYVEIADGRWEKEYSPDL